MHDRHAGEQQELNLRFPASDTFDYLNFVIKETTSNSWYALGIALEIRGLHEPWGFAIMLPCCSIRTCHVHQSDWEGPMQ